MNSSITGKYRALADHAKDLATGQTMGGYESGLSVLTDATVMMVDDEPTTLEVIQTYLEDAGYSRFNATTRPADVLAMLAANRPDILLLGLTMPEVSGFDILRGMQADPQLRYLPVIVLTSEIDAATKLRALELGATDLLAKPVDPSELALRLRNALAFKAYQDRLAYCDPLTGLPNRLAFITRLTAALERGRHRGASSALLYIDVDRFKQINDTLGHGVGDALLRGVADRLQRSVRDSDIVGRLAEKEFANTVSRVGGDEFVALLPGLVHADHAALIAQRLLATISQPFQITSQELFVTCSIGIAVAPHDGDDAEALLKHADVAMGQAKRRGRNSCAFYNRALNERSLERLTLQNDLHKALERDEFALHFQPKIDIVTGKISGAEVLVRWNHPQRGTISPDDFIALAEETGLIVPLGAWVLKAACAQAKAWQLAGLKPFPISVNVSAAQLRQDGYIGTLREALRRSGLAPQYLMLELTESVIMEDARERVDMLRVVRDMGLKLSIDDFGTGYSSLSYLKRFPVHEIKIDRSFIKGLPDETESAAIVRAIVTLATGLGFAVVAEGVETDRQLAFLKANGCHQYQGYRFSKPLAAAEFAALVRAATRAKSPQLVRVV
jgi:predicted signal transduction protein with EAL and GGDEF domain